VKKADGTVFNAKGRGLRARVAEPPRACCFLLRRPAGGGGHGGPRSGTRERSDCGYHRGLTAASTASPHRLGVQRRAGHGGPCRGVRASSTVSRPTTMPTVSSSRPDHAKQFQFWGALKGRYSTAQGNAAGGALGIDGQFLSSP